MFQEQDSGIEPHDSIHSPVLPFEDFRSST